MYHPSQFFAGYLVDHHAYKVVTLKNIVDNYDALGDKVLEGVKGVERDKYIDSLRIEIRSTYYQAIETLFELIFALFHRGGYIDNTKIWYFLSTSQGQANYARISQIAEGKLEFMDDMILAGKRKDGEEIDVPFGEYLFYFNVSAPEIREKIPEAIKTIKKALVEFAKEFSDRGEYNAIKHALRIFPTVSQMFISPTGKGDWTKIADMTGSMSYLARGPDKSLNVHVVPMDTERDVRMTLLCSSLIANIFQTRRHLGKSAKEEPIYLACPTEEDFNDLSKREAQVLNFVFKITPNPLEGEN